MNVPINVRHVCVAVLKTEAKEGNTYEKLVELAPAMQASFSPETSSTTLYGNGIKQAIATKVGEETISLGLNYLSLEHLALLGGHKYQKDNPETGQESLIKSDADKAPYVAVFVTVDGEDNTCRSYAYWKVKFKETEESIDQSEDSVNFSTPTIEGGAVSSLDANVSERIDWTPEDLKECPDYKTLFNVQVGK